MALCLLYYMPYKFVQTFVNIAFCYYSIYKYAKYFAMRQPKVIEDEVAVGIVLKLEKEAESRPESFGKARCPKSNKARILVAGESLSQRWARQALCSKSHDRISAVPVLVSMILQGNLLHDQLRRR